MLEEKIWEMALKALWTGPYFSSVQTPWPHYHTQNIDWLMIISVHSQVFRSCCECEEA